MDAIKQAVVQTLEKQGIITQLKAQLRAQVFIAVDEYDSTASGSGLAAKTSVPSRDTLLSDEDGQVVVQLVLDLLDTCNFAFTKKVFQPELGPKAPEGRRQAVAQKLGLKPASTDEPLLLTLLKAYKSGSSGRPAESSGSGAAAATVPKSATGSSTIAALTAAAPLPASTAAASATSSAISGSASARNSSTPAAPRLDSLPTVNKTPLAPLPQLGSAAGKLQDPLQPVQTGASAATAAKPIPEPSAAETAYSDEEFEDEPVEEEVEEEGAGAAADDDEDYATALGVKVTATTGSKGGINDSLDGTRDRPAASFGAGIGGARCRTPLDSDLMAGDRSFGISNELAGLDAGNSGGLSYSADGFGGANDLRGSLSSSQAMLSPISEGTPKPAKLEPLRPLSASKLAPLAPLAPLPNMGTLSSSLTASKEDPLGAKGPKALAPLGGPVRKPLAEEKEELRRLGLLQSGDSLSNSVEVESRPRAGNIYDAEMSVSASMDDGGPWSSGAGGAGTAGRDGRLPFGSKGLSMDLRETGLSASDRSGDIEHMGVDLAETAEWH